MFLVGHASFFSDQRRENSQYTEKARKKVSEREEEERMIGSVLLNILFCQGCPWWLMCYDDYRLYIEETLERSF